jgi:hypothetical protein
MRNALTALVLLGALLWATGCSTDENSAGLAPNCISFVPDIGDDPPPSGEVTALFGPDSTCNTLDLQLVVSGVDDIFSAQFEIVYPTGIAQVFQVDLNGSFLFEDGVTPLLNFDVVNGRAEIGFTRQDTNNGGVTPPVDNTLLAVVRFARIATTSSGTLSFEDATLSVLPDPAGPPVEVTVPFNGGVIAVD